MPKGSPWSHAALEGYQKNHYQEVPPARIPMRTGIFIKKSNTAENFAVDGTAGKTDRLRTQSLMNGDSEDPEI